MTCSYGRANVSMVNAVQVFDATPIIKFLQQDPAAADGSFYAELYGYNFGPAPGSVAVCFYDPTGDPSGTDPCNGPTGISVCLSVACGAVYGYWSDNHVNVLLTPPAGTSGTYDVIITSGGESPGLGFQAAPAGISQSRSNRMQVQVQPPAPPAPRIFQGGQDITNSQQTVIVGQQIALNGMNTGGPFTNQYWTLNGTYVGGFSASVARGCTMQVNAPDCNTPANTTGPNVTFYFVAPATAVTIRYSLTGANGAVFSASTTFNVVAPTLTGSPPIASGLGPTGVLLDTNSNQGPGILSLHYGGGTGTPGMRFADALNVTVAGYAYSLEWIQLVVGVNIAVTDTSGNPNAAASYHCQGNRKGTGGRS